jgi:hypothetical protein
MLFIIATYCSKQHKACFNVNSDKICQGKIVAEDQKNPVYTYYRLISAKKVILGEYHWLMQRESNKQIFNEYISGRGAGDGTMNEYIYDKHKLHLKRTVEFTYSDSDPQNLIDITDRRYSGSDTTVSMYSSVPRDELHECWNGDIECNIPLQYITK